MSKNDKRILELKTKINAKRNKIGEITKFTPNTNCKYGTVNLRTIGKGELELLTIDVQTKLHFAIELSFTNTEIHGFYLQEWKEDMLQLLKIKDQKQQIKELREAEDRITILLSKDKKTELEINDLEELLGL